MHDHWARYGFPVHIQLATFLGSSNPNHLRQRIADDVEAPSDDGDDFIRFMMGIAPGGSG